MSEGRDVQVFFGVGDLCSRDRKVSFLFDKQYNRLVKKATDASESDGGNFRGASRMQSGRSERLVIHHDGYAKTCADSDVKFGEICLECRYVRVLCMLSVACV